mmetsp:Transcript_24611/g.28449  ORF Transcript_24611/g.28449 Transcript_24611/m.28449 type:complete len:217 (-) Transcript_24611:46-696(-)
MKLNHSRNKPLSIFLLIMSMIIHKATCLSILNPNKMKPPLKISEEIGTSPTLKYEYFDPLNLANEYNFVTYREAELKHGRIAMLAVIGNTLPELFRGQLIPPKNVFLSPSDGLCFSDVPTGLKALTVVPIIGWLQIIAFIGFFETQIFIQRDRRDLPGDYGIGYFGVRDKRRHERSLRSELENGRLAMLAFAAQVLIELITGDSVGVNLMTYFQKV